MSFLLLLTYKYSHIPGFVTNWKPPSRATLSEAEMSYYTLVALITLALVANASAESPEWASRKLNIFKVKSPIKVPCSPACKCLPGGCDSDAAKALSIKDPCKNKKNGPYTEKWRRKDQVKKDNCGWASGLSVCKTAWGKQQGGDEVLKLGRDAALACMGCTAGCAACAGNSLAEGLAREV